MSSMDLVCALGTAVCCVGISPVNADVTLPPIFSDHAVLQKSRQTPVWGTAAPGEQIIVSLGTSTANASADADGRWRVNLNLETIGPGPFDLTVQGSNRLIYHDVLVGEVWLCSGQSNMEFVLSNSAEAKAEVARSANPMVRQFSVGYKASLGPEETFKGYWSTASPGTSGQFTAVGYYFAQKLQKTLGVPVAIISSSWGGTPIETWISSEALDRDPALRVSKDSLKEIERRAPERIKAFAAAYRSWAEMNAREDLHGADVRTYAAPDADLTGWKPVTIPGKVAAAGLPDAGAVWLRRDVVVSSHEAGSSLYMPLGLPHESDTVYWNGQQIAETTIESGGSANLRIYNVPARLVREGKATLAIRLFAPVGGAGITDETRNFRAGGIGLNGEWLAKVEREIKPVSAAALASRPATPAARLPVQSVPTTCFNGKINPIIPFGIRGILWYQGESNVGHADLYRAAFPLLIEDWRERWGQRDLPFFFCQLPNFEALRDSPAESARAELREAQAAALSLPNTGMVTLIDSGETGNLHPRDKRTPGERLAQLALVRTYHQSGAASGPVFGTMTVEGKKVRIRYSSGDNGLRATAIPATYRRTSTDTDAIPLPRNSPQSQLEGFAICGADRKWHWADARIDGATVVVWSSDIPAPVSVRYAWAGSPIVNLYNSDGLPAVPFRTDAPAAGPVKPAASIPGESLH